MPSKKLKEFLDGRGAKYVSIQHSTAYTAPEVAESAHIAGSDFAKTVIVKIDGEMAMVVLPANRKIVLSDLRDMLVGEKVELATEDEFQSRFPDCELGAMPPFGNLYGIPIYVDARLAMDADEIAFNAGSHTDAVRMPYAEFERLTQPELLYLAHVM
jgi:Ala-tRNA(Pro) deacylase